MAFTSLPRRCTAATRISLRQKQDDLSFNDWLKLTFGPAESRLFDQMRIGSHTIAASSPSDASQIMQHMIDLFDSPDVLTAYAPERLDQGLMTLLGCDGDIGAIWDSRVPLLLRRQCVQAMGNLFSTLFTKDVAPTACFMWWEMVWLAGVGFDPIDCRCKAIADTMVDVLDHLLTIESRPVQESALHGLSHLDHPLASATAQKFLHRHPDIDPALRAHAMRCITRVI